jgi:hypothetical protein
LNRRKLAEKCQKEQEAYQKNMLKSPIYSNNRISAPNSTNMLHSFNNFNSTGTTTASTQMTIIPSNAMGSLTLNPSQTSSLSAPKFQLLYRVQPQLQQFQQSKVLIQNLNSNMNANVQYLNNPNQYNQSYQSNYQLVKSNNIPRVQTNTQQQTSLYTTSMNHIRPNYVSSFFLERLDSQLYSFLEV